MVLIGATECRQMEANSGWRSWDFLAGGILTAGIAFGAYKLGRNNNTPCARGSSYRPTSASGAVVRARNSSVYYTDHDSSIASVTDVETSRMRECVALALKGGSQMHLQMPQPDRETQRLAESLRRSQLQQSLASPRQTLGGGLGDRIHTRGTARNDVYTTCVSPANANPNRPLRHHLQQSSPQSTLTRTPQTASPSYHPQASPQHRTPVSPQRTPGTPDIETSPTEHAKQLQAYRQRLDKWVVESEAKINQLEQQRLALSADLQMTHEALARSRQDQEAEERNRRAAESRLKELEDKVQHMSVIENQLVAKQVHVQQLEKQVSELEEQWEKLFQDNIVMPRDAARDNVQQHEELRQSVECLKVMVQERDRDIEERDNEITNLSVELRKAKKDQRGLAEENARFQKEAHTVCEALQGLVSLMWTHWGHLADTSSHEMDSLAKVVSEDLTLDEMLTRITAAVKYIAAHTRRRQL